jgi:anti-anti-sigma factor
MEAFIIEQSAPRVFRLLGEFDAHRAGDAASVLESEVLQHGDLSLDLSELDFIDTTAVAVLNKLAMDLEERGRLRLLNPPVPVRKVIEAVELDKRQNVDLIDEPS